MFYNKVSKASEKKISFGISRCGDNCVHGYVNCKATDIFLSFWNINHIYKCGFKCHECSLMYIWLTLLKPHMCEDQNSAEWVGSIPSSYWSQSLNQVIRLESDFNCCERHLTVFWDLSFRFEVVITYAKY